MQLSTGKAADGPERLVSMVNALAQLLPAQGPLTVFVHHNTLHALEHLPFADAVREAQVLYGARAYMDQATFLAHYRTGRIRERDLKRALDLSLFDSSRQPLCLGLSERKVRELAVRHHVQHLPAAEVAYQIDEGDALREPREDAPSLFTRALGDPEQWPRQLRALWKTCEQLASAVVTHAQPATRFQGRWLQPFKGLRAEVNDSVNPLLIRYTAAYLDQGAAAWPMPQREAGFFRALCSLWSAPGLSISSPLVGLPKPLAHFARMTPARCLDACLHELGVTACEEEEVLRDMLLALPGWAGMVARLELRAEDRAPDAPRASLLEWLAIRALLELAAVRRLSGAEPPWKASLPPPEHSVLESAYELFQLFQLAGVTAEQALRASANDAHELLQVLERFDPVTRCAIWQVAYERSYYRELLDAIGTPRPPVRRARPSLQAMFCIDDREESLRRHLEELAPGAETFGLAGFFGIAMDFRGVDDATHSALCPLAVVPQHEVEERAQAGHERSLARRHTLRRHWAAVSQAAHAGSHSLLRGALVHGLLGFASGLPLALGLLAPRTARAMSAWLERAILPCPSTELHAHAQGRTSERGRHIGFSLEDQASRVAFVLRSSGLAENLAPLVLILGHGASSLNNPHESAYSCGACSGRSGGPNARLFAQLANEPQVRAKLLSEGIAIPADTRFVGGVHDTTTDAITFYDLERLPASHAQRFADARRTLDEARARNAQERCRRFETAKLTLSPRAALRHVERRAHALDEPRPECGHATNAAAVLGPRWLTRGLFLDRRVLLTSYEPSGDLDGKVLEATLAAVTPVCAGINLEYYFSFVDNEVYGAGSKLPHNLCAELGVVTGQASDLRTGLPWQMVELHEPMRLLMIVYAPMARLEQVLARLPRLRGVFERGWAQLACLTPEGRRYMFEQGRFLPLPMPGAHLFEAESSRAYYEGRRGHLRIARIVGKEARRAG
jgi:uncharacterized protein YbcC (UPF0753/DUF2309 family)